MTGHIFLKIWGVLALVVGGAIMRAVLFFAAVMLVGSGSPTYAQSATEGPLAAPDALPIVKPVKPAKETKRRKPAKAARRAPSKDDGSFEPTAAAASRPVTPPPGTPLPADPVDFGMKWNGNNDTARGTRVQNYDGNAEGTGAEVGMKLHF